MCIFVIFYADAFVNDGYAIRQTDKVCLFLWGYYNYTTICIYCAILLFFQIISQLISVDDYDSVTLPLPQPLTFLTATSQLSVL